MFTCLKDIYIIVMKTILLLGIFISIESYIYNNFIQFNQLNWSLFIIESVIMIMINSIATIVFMFILNKYFRILTKQLKKNFLNNKYF